MCSQNRKPLKTKERASFTNLNLHFPAYGKILLKIRRSELVPIRMVMVVFDWCIARVYPRIVITDDIPIERLNVSYLAGIPVQIVYRNKDAHHIKTLVETILKVNPSFLATFCLDLIDTGHSRVIVRPCREVRVKVIESCP